MIDNSRAYLHIIERNRQLIEEGRRLSEVASRDALTGALNHGGIVRAAERAWMEAAETHKPVDFIMIDIDYFKQINDSFGHGGGDTALKEFTRRLAGVIRQTDQLGRYGGEEFLVILGGAATSESLMRTAERLRQAIVTAPFKLGGEARSVSASFGAALSNGVYESAQDLLAAADRALYAAKNGGRNRIVIVSDALSAPSVRPRGIRSGIYSTPLLFRLARDCRRCRVLDLHPVRRAARSIRRAVFEGEAVRPNLVRPRALEH